jgi:hypothetical protein
MSSADVYQQHAAECYSLAEDFSDPHGREIMRQLAVMWLHLSEQTHERASENPQQEAGQDRSA